MFESRGSTRRRLLKLRLSGRRSPPPENAWLGFEVFRGFEATERYTLGAGTTVIEAQLWTSETVACVRRSSGVKVVFFGVNSSREYGVADALRPDAVLVDSVANVKESLEEAHK